MTAFQLEDPDGLYEYSGYFTLRGGINGPNSVWGTKEGKLTLKFKDGVVYTMNDPLVIVNGIITGNKVHTFMHHCLLVDETNGIVGDLHFNPWTDNTYKGMVKRAAFSLGGLAKKIKGSSNEDPNKKKKRADDVHIQIY